MFVGVASGRKPDIGVGGLILGAGLSHFASKYGMVCDNVEELERVLFDSTIVHATRGDKQDLFWCLKGGGANSGKSTGLQSVLILGLKLIEVGIMTRYTLGTISVEKIWFKARNYHHTQNKQNNS